MPQSRGLQGSSAGYFSGTSKLGELSQCQHCTLGALTLGKPRFMSALVSITRWPSPALAPLSLSGDNYPTFQGLDASFWCVTGTLIVRLLHM